MTPADQGWKPLRAGPFMQLIGPLMRRETPQGRRYALAAAAEHGNLVGLVHGGALASLLDHAMAVEAWEIAERRPVVTVQMELRCLAAARPGGLIEAEVRLLRRAGSMMFLEATARSGETAIAAASTVMKIARDKTGAREESA